MSSHPLVEISGLSKSYGAFHAVKSLDLNVGAGEIFALLGPNGAGKTTTIRMLMGILSPTSGSARIAGLDCFAERVPVKRKVGYLPDEPVFYDYLRGRELIRYTGEMHGLDNRETMRRAQPLIARLELGDALEEYAVNYSKGMKKKLALICAMLHEPDLLILDEPTRGIDVGAKYEIYKIVNDLAESGKAIILISSEMPEILGMADRIYVMNEGAIAAEMPAAEASQERIMASIIKHGAAA